MTFASLFMAPKLSVSHLIRKFAATLQIKTDAKFYRLGAKTPKHT